MKLTSIIIFILVFVLAVGGGLGVVFWRNTFTVENSSAGLNNQIVYLTADDLIKDPQELVNPEPDAAIIKVLPNEVGYLNVRSGSGVSNAKVGQVKPGDELEYTEIENNWYHVVLSGDKTGWVSGDYVKEIENTGD